MPEDKRTALLQSTVRAVAKHGMKDVSTRSISGDAGINDAYIYRFFKDKEDMLMQAYFLEHDRFLRQIGKTVEALYTGSITLPFREQCLLVFHSAWRYLIDTPNVCRFFVYYYHSPNFEKYAREGHRKQVDLIAEHIDCLFDSLEDTEDCLYALFSLLYTFALQVVNGETLDDEDTWERVSRMLYNTICAQMKHPPEEQEKG